MSRRVWVAVVVLILCSMSAWAQWPVDSAKRTALAEAKNKSKDELLVIDGYPVDSAKLTATLNSLTEKNVFDVIILTKGQAVDQNMIIYAHTNVVIVTTKTAVSAHYKKTLTALSLDYRNYLDTHHNDDSDLQYIVNNIPLKSNTDEQLDMLYKLGPEKIANVAFTEVKGKKTLIIDVRYDE